MKWFDDPLGLYRSSRESQLEVLGLLRELFGSPVSEAAVAFLLGVPRLPRAALATPADPSSLEPPSSVSSDSQEPGAARRWPRPPWLIAQSEDAARRNDLFRVA